MSDIASVIPARWRHVGIQLGLKSDFLDSIQFECCGRPHYCQDAFEKVFEEWKKRQTAPYTWKTIIDAIEKIGEVALANNLKKKLYLAYNM